MTEMASSRRWVLKRQFVGMPKESDFELIEEPIGDLQDGEVMIESLVIPVDPYQRLFMSNSAPGSPIMGSQVAKVIQSKNKDFAEGSIVITYAGWTDRCRVNPSDASLGPPGFPMISLPPDIGSLDPSHLVGACGMSGMSAYFAFTEICQPKAGEIVVVNSAAGAVGSLVGQIAKIFGCKVIGFAGTDEKVKMLKEELGFDEAFNYKKMSVDQALTLAAADGVDCFFDNIGGAETYTVLTHMNQGGRIAACGSISTYGKESKDIPRIPAITELFIIKELRMQGFIIMTYLSRWNEGINVMARWIRDGKIIPRESFIQGFENVPKAFESLFAGDFSGKLLVKM